VSQILSGSAWAVSICSLLLFVRQIASPLPNKVVFVADQLLLGMSLPLLVLGFISVLWDRRRAGIVIWLSVASLVIAYIMPVYAEART